MNQYFFPCISIYSLIFYPLFFLLQSCYFSSRFSAVHCLLDSPLVFVPSIVLSIVQSKSLPLAPLAEQTVHFYSTSLIPLSCQSQEGKHRERPRKGKGMSSKRKYMSYYTSNTSNCAEPHTHTYNASSKLTQGACFSNLCTSISGQLSLCLDK